MKFAKNDRYIVAVSGGPDSVFLVYWLLNHGYRNLILAHVNYHWRENSDDDQSIVELLGKKFNLPIEIKSLKAHQEKPKIKNFEAWAREQRYDFFNHLSKKHQTSLLIVGHQENDLIETYLMQKNRSGLVEYFGLPTLTHHHQLDIWRPLLKYKKSDILKWLNNHQIDYALDQTNEDLNYQRNQIRSELNESAFSKIKEKILIDNQTNQKQMEIVNKYLNTNQKNTNLVIKPEIKHWDPKLIQRLIYQFFENQNFDNKLIRRKKQLLQEITNRLLKSNKNFWLFDFGDVILLKDYDTLRFLFVKNLPSSKITLNSKNDFSKIKKFENVDQIITTIKDHHYQFPYQIYTLEPNQIRGIKWQKKSLAKSLAKCKISYEKRLKTGIIYSFRQNEFLDNWDWQLI